MKRTIVIIATLSILLLASSSQAATSVKANGYVLRDSGGQTTYFTITADDNSTYQWHAASPRLASKSDANAWLSTNKTRILCDWYRKQYMDAVIPNDASKTCLQNWNKWLTDYAATNVVVTPAQTKSEWKKLWRERNTTQQWVAVNKGRCTEPYTEIVKVPVMIDQNSTDENGTIHTVQVQKTTPSDHMDENGTLVVIQVPVFENVTKTKKRLLSSCRILADKSFEEYQTIIPTNEQAEAAANAPGGFTQQPDTTVSTVVPRAAWKGKFPSNMVAY
jgi:hypothetical protein